MAYQAAVAVITPALISGAIVGRMKLIPYMIFVFLWTTVCYDPLCRWSFYKDGIDCVFFERERKYFVLGWLRVLGSLDYSGGTAVHIASGVSGLIAAMILGERHDYGKMIFLVYIVGILVEFRSNEGKCSSQSSVYCIRHRFPMGWMEWIQCRCFFSFGWYILL